MLLSFHVFTLYGQIQPAGSCEEEKMWCSVGDLDSNPFVFGPSGCGSVIICTDPDPDLDSDHQAKIVRKTLISTVL